MTHVKGLDGGHVEGKDALSKVKEVGKYTKYLEGLSGYLASLYERTHPLSDWKEVTATMRGEFEAAWEVKDVSLRLDPSKPAYVVRTV